MPFATCRRCNAVFIVSTEHPGEEPGLCPYCGQALAPISSEEAREHVEKKWPQEGDDTERGRPEARWRHRSPSRS